MRSWLPREIGGVLWFGNDDANMVAFNPIYCCTTKAPRCFNTPGVDALRFSMDNAYWVCNWVSNMVYPRYSQMFGSLKQVRDSLDASWLSRQCEVDRRAQELYASSPEQAVNYLTAYGAEKAEQMLQRWQQLAFYLIVKYNDMIVKPEQDGRLLRTPHGLGARVQRPGYPERYARELIRQTGDKLAVPTK